jgi:membrane protein implicated in regulation of membrane protease activity
MTLDPELITWLFFVGGLLLMVLETVLPGGVAFFLGTGGLIIAALRAMGLLIDPLTAALTWVFLSTALTIVLRPIAMRYFGGDTSLKMTDEDAEAMGQTVKVIESVGETSPGRIRFRGAEWDARTMEGRLPKGATAKLLYRENLTWIVEPADYAELEDDLDSEFDPPDTESDRDSGGLGYDPSASSNREPQR